MNSLATADARNFGDPAAEYDAARNGCAFIIRTDRALLRVYGRDPVRIVQGIVTNDVAGAAPDRAVYAALLTPKGRMVADMRIVRRGADLLLDVPAAALDALLDNFKRTIPPLFARFENVNASHVMISVIGPLARTTAATALQTQTQTQTPSQSLADLEPVDGFAAVAFGDAEILALTTRDTGSDDVDLIAPADAANDIARALSDAGAVRIGVATRDVLRIEAGTPVWGAELDENTIPLEADLKGRAISTGKGCYTGQEVIIRILHRGHVNWHLRGFLLGDAPTPAAGDTMTTGDAPKVTGRITSAAYSPRFAQTIALGYARREVEPGTALSMSNGSSATVVALPFVTGGP